MVSASPNISNPKLKSIAIVSHIFTNSFNSDLGYSKPPNSIDCNRAYSPSSFNNFFKGAEVTNYDKLIGPLSHIHKLTSDMSI
jgi:hypothetical protein